MKQRTKTLSLLALALVLAAGTSAAQSATSAEKSASTPAVQSAVQSSTSALTSAATRLYTRLKAQHPRLGLRTNLLSWSILSPSLGVDLQWGTRWQATLDGSIGLMSTAPHDGHARYTRISSIGLEARRYFNPNSNPLAAPHHGLYLALGIRHMHLDYKHRSSPTHIGREGTLNTAGIIMGYTITLPAHLTIDAAAGAGYLHRYYNRYTWYPPAHQNRLLSRQNKGMLGLTHAEVSIVYHFNLK